MDINLQYNLPNIKKSEPQLNPEGSDPVVTPVASDYTLIAEQNLFHPDRKIPEKKDEKQLPKPEFVLYGTLITDNAGIAFIEDMKSPYNTAGRGKRQKAIQKGTVFSGFTLAEIHHDKVVMLRGEERIEVRVAEQQNKKERTAVLPTSGDTKSGALAGSEVKSESELSPRGRAEVKTSAPKADRKEKEQQKAERRALRKNPNP